MHADYTLVNARKMNNVQARKTDKKNNNRGIWSGARTI